MNKIFQRNFLPSLPLILSLFEPVRVLRLAHLNYLAECLDLLDVILPARSVRKWSTGHLLSDAVCNARPAILLVKGATNRRIFLWYDWEMVYHRGYISMIYVLRSCFGWSSHSRWHFLSQPICTFLRRKRHHFDVIFNREQGIGIYTGHTYSPSRIFLGLIQNALIVTTRLPSSKIG